jgi:hypothetical protein
MSRGELLFSVSIKDCKVESLRNSKGAGGQHRDKTSSAQRVTHEPSGASAYCQDHREQYRNKRDAFLKMIRTPQFKSWHRRMINELSGMPTVEQVVEEQMTECNIMIEVRGEKGWEKI